MNNSRPREVENINATEYWNKNDFLILPAKIKLAKIAKILNIKVKTQATPSMFIPLTWLVDESKKGTALGYDNGYMPT